MRPSLPVTIAALLLIAALVFGPPIALPSIPWLPSWAGTKPTAATYVYEKDSTAVPPAVLAGLNRLNRERQLLATAFEEDTLDGTGQTPRQYVAALEAARNAGLPTLVVTAGEKVLRVVRDPQTEEQVWEAAR